MKKQVWHTPKEVAEYLRVSVETLAQWRWKKFGPKSYPVVHPGGSRKRPLVRYHCDDLDAWVRQTPPKDEKDK